MLVIYLSIFIKFTLVNLIRILVVIDFELVRNIPNNFYLIYNFILLPLINTSSKIFHDLSS
jgi:hypothetical protein